VTTKSQGEKSTKAGPTELISLAIKLEEKTEVRRNFGTNWVDGRDEGRAFEIRPSK
jgi:hypothetical protein